MTSDEIAALAAPLADLSDLDPLLDRVGDARVVMLGEASHGTHEYYVWRDALTRLLIEEKGFSFVAVEGDWPDCERVDRSVRCRDDAPADPREALMQYERWPTWMWANEEVVDFTRWLRAHNSVRPDGARAGFHGLDVYSLWESMREILTYLREHDPELVPAALSAYRCFEPYREDPQRYAMATRFVPTRCETEVVDLLVALRAKGEFAPLQNAEVVSGAERYYRALVQGGSESWNVRDRHMDETLARLLDHYGDGAKAVVWAHNTHVGDARATDMARYGEVNVGQLARQRFGADDVVLVGFGSHRGTVVAAREWGAPMQVMTMPPARRNSLEDLFTEYAPASALFLLEPGMLAADHRAIGVVYHPERERYGNYVPTVLGDRYDAFCWFDETEALRPLHPAHADVMEPETFPSGV